MITPMYVIFPKSSKAFRRAWTFKTYCSAISVKVNPERSAIENVNADLSEITPNFRSTFNIASYINRSETLQKLLYLNVNLSKIEKKPFIAEKFLRLDFDRDMKNHILFLTDFIGMEKVGEFLTKNPMIFYEDLEDLKVRINYLNSKGFIENQIQRIIANNPYWLMFNTVRIDRRLAYFQENFDLVGKEVRLLATKQPRLITYNIQHVRTNTFVVREEMGFENCELKQLLLDKPRIWMLNQKCLLERFNFIHNIMKIPHSVIVINPEVLLCRTFKIKQRHLFLDKLGRAQYDKNKENYVPIASLIKNSDVEFCNNYAKCNVDDFNIFLKTL